ncbi:hypothetical protein H0H87_012398 [Tephrocybe sp. NHM501043]|nr:hypothetical protein H0H87_012398 [Tephrocybe sp. NHM501043]
MLGSLRHVACLSSRRLYSTEPPLRVPVALIGQLRKLTEVSITKAREALSASNNDVDLALQWLEKDRAISGAAKAAKVEGRATGEGVICTAVLSRGAGFAQGGLRAAMVELNCETDFVGRTEQFARLAADIAHTAAFISEPHRSQLFHNYSMDMLNDAPLISESSPNPSTSVTVGSSVRDLIAKVGEKISLRRAVTIVDNPPQEQVDLGLRLASYNHGSTGVATQGRVGSLALLALKSPRLPELLASEGFVSDLARLERSLARQIAGYPTLSVRSAEGQELDTALYHQDFAMFPDNPNDKVAVALQKWASAQGLGEDGAAVVDLKRWTVGEVLVDQVVDA